MERENLVPCFEKKLSKTDATGNLEIPMNALHLPAVDNEIMNVRHRDERIWEFKAPARRDGSGRRYMTCQWRQFVRENDLVDGDIVKFSWSTADEYYHVVTVKKLRTLQLFPGAPL
ncbi:hypothetical protein CsSME_00028436 [Camellia sinensis var. sinensis]